MPSRTLGPAECETIVLFLFRMGPVVGVCLDSVSLEGRRTSRGAGDGRGSPACRFLSLLVEKHFVRLINVVNSECLWREASAVRFG